MAVYVGVDSGAPFDDACIETFKDMKDNGAYKYLIFRVQTDGNKIKVSSLIQFIYYILLITIIKKKVLYLLIVNKIDHCFSGCGG